MRSLGGKVQESTFCDILHNAVLQVCREKYWADSPDWEVDGVICISVPHSQEQHVVKIHQKFPSDSGKHFDNRCFECDRKPKDALSTNETSERHFNESVEEDDSSYRNVSVIDLEHASTQPNPAQTCGQGTIPPSLPSPVREQNSHNFYASPDLSGFGPNVHRQKSEQLKNSSGQSHSKTNNRSKDQEHSSSFTSHPRETTPPRKKSKTEPEEYVVVKAEPDDDEDFALHMECIDEKESDNTAEIKDENIQRDLAAETQEDINFLLNVEGPSASHQFNSGDRSWGQRLPTSTVTSQMDTNLSSMAGQGSQGFSNLNLLTHGVDIEDGTMRLTTRVQHPSFIAGQTDSNTPEQRTIPRPSGQDSAAASNAIGDATFKSMMKIKSEMINPEEFYCLSTDKPSTSDADYNYSMLAGDPSDPHSLSTPGSYIGMYDTDHLGNISEQGRSNNQSTNKGIKKKSSVFIAGKQKSKYRKREYTCNFCGKIYHHSTRLKNHVVQNHSTEMKVETPNSGTDKPQPESDSINNPLNTDQQPSRTEDQFGPTDNDDSKESGNVKTTKAKSRPAGHPRSGRRTRSNTRSTQVAHTDPVPESTSDQLSNESQPDHIRLEVRSYQNDDEMCRRQVVLSGMLGDRLSSMDQGDDTKTKNNDGTMVKQQVSTSTTDMSGDTTDEANIQFWCKCGQSFTSLSTFVLHKFPCEAAMKSDEK
ncbi:uncharacterized protein LOC117328731 isoform X1 [Pecten maximus]|uniref:uncharacterized protein LOC117328731 isoform X1 n=1 Tax=Pecten maximus TaxID=6579 RepID=UPI0014583E16|nr:uncharacterized protein LOC117328731 isoform X1 [Pecten maximus]